MPGWLRKIPHSIYTKFFIIHARHLDVYVYPVQQRTRDPLLIFGHDSRCATARFLAVPVEPNRVSGEKVLEMVSIIA